MNSRNSKLWLISLVILLATAMWMHNIQNEPLKLDPGQLSVGGVTLGMPREQVTALLGWDANDSDVKAVPYSAADDRELVIAFANRPEVAVQVDGDRLEKNGEPLLMIGDSREKVFSVLGKPNLQAPLESPDAWNVQDKAWIHVTYVHKSGTQIVSRIQLGGWPPSWR